METSHNFPSSKISTREIKKHPGQILVQLGHSKYAWVLQIFAFAGFFGYYTTIAVRGGYRIAKCDDTYLR